MRPTTVAAAASTVNTIFQSGFNFVQLASGTNFVTVSGLSVSVSGNVVGVSGQIAAISGQVVNVSGAIVSISGSVTTITSVSGNVARISGDVVKVSGEAVKISGSPVAISGNVIYLPNDNTNNVITISGNSIQPSYNANTSVRGRNVALIGAASGGVVLTSADCSQITIRAVSSNTGSIFVGGTNTVDAPWGVTSESGNGFVLGPGDGITFPISNFNLVKVACFSGAGGTNSGNKISYFGVQY